MMMMMMMMMMKAMLKFLKRSKQSNTLYCGKVVAGIFGYGGGMTMGTWVEKEKHFNFKNNTTLLNFK